MRKLRRIFFILSIIIILFSNYSANALQGETVKISAYGDNIYKVKYKNYYMTSKMIDVNGQVGYCLDIHKNYPTGEQFHEIQYNDDGVKAIIFAGFPNKSPKELGLDSDQQAFFATQIAVWCYIEKYDISEIICKNKNIENAIKGIYLNGINNKDTLIQNSGESIKTYFYADGVQRIMAFYKTNNTVKPPKVFAPNTVNSGLQGGGEVNPHLKLGELQPNTDMDLINLPKTGGISGKTIICFGLVLIITGYTILVKGNK